MKKRIVSLITMIVLVVALIPATVATSSASTNVVYTWPTDNRSITGHWGLESGHYYPYHYGIDISASKGANVYAAAPGKVIFAGWYDSYGRCVQIKHANGQVTLYAHNSKIITKYGAEVERGDVIAKVGGSGVDSNGSYSDYVYPNHLHFGIYINTGSLSKEDGRKASEITLNPEKLLKNESANTYTIAYSDGDGSTSYAEDAKMIPSHTAKSGVNSATTTKKFTRSGYHYDKWYIFKLVNGKAHYWCREKSTGGNPKWIAYDKIPSNYYKTSISHGGKISFSLKNIKIYLTPVWQQNTYILRYSDGISSTSYDVDSKKIANQTIKSGEYTRTSTKKFVRAGYSYNAWYIFKLVNGKAHYWCREKSTGDNPKWIAYDKIPSNYYKTTISCGGNIYFTPAHGSIIFLTPAWKYNSKDINNLNIAFSKNQYTYTGEKIAPAVAVKTSKNAVLKKGTDYTVTYQKSPINVGTYKVTVKGKGNYTGSKVLAYEINPKGTSVKSLSKGKQAFKVKWKKNSKQTTGYQIRYSTSSKMSNAKTKTIKSYKTTSCTIKSLKAKKKYYVQIRTYKTVGSKTYYSGWSAKKSVKIR